jgi:hypothetical protein
MEVQANPLKKSRNNEDLWTDTRFWLVTKVLETPDSAGQIRKPLRETKRGREAAYHTAAIKETESPFTYNHGGLERDIVS